MVIEAAGGDDRVKTNYLHTTLAGVARSWLINLPEGTVYNWDQLYAMFTRNFQGLRRQSSRSLMKVSERHFYNARNAIPYIKGIEIIIVFHDEVNDINIVEEITMKKPKMVVDLLAVANVCIEARRPSPAP
jgi:hypothetical protein